MKTMVWSEKFKTLGQRASNLGRKAVGTAQSLGKEVGKEAVFLGKQAGQVGKELRTEARPFRMNAPLMPGSINQNFVEQTTYRPLAPHQNPAGFVRPARTHQVTLKMKRRN